jgi:hypothetical protein
MNSPTNRERFSTADEAFVAGLGMATSLGSEPTGHPFGRVVVDSLLRAAGAGLGAGRDHRALVRHHRDRRVFLRVVRAAGILLLPYLAWVSFATVLNASLWLLNRLPT